MDQDRPTALRGFDSYAVRLGDELRGHRATLGRSLLDVQRDLRIKAAYIDAIENCDASVIPQKGFVAGYVRAYARYLGLDGDAVYARFCEESGFSAQGGGPAKAGGGAGLRRGGGFGGGLGGALGGRDRDPALSRSHFASPVGRARPVGLGVSLSDLASVGVLAALIGGLGWGVWLVVEDIQRVDFAPGETAPEAAPRAPGALPGLALQAAPAPWLTEGPERDAALAELYAPRAAAAPPVVALRDGPMAAIDPARSGLYPGLPGRPAAEAGIADAPIAATAPDAGPAVAPVLASAEPQAPAEAASGVHLVAAADCWVQVTDASGAVLYERIMQAGDRWQAPDRGEGLTLRAGNAGGLTLEVDGRAHGPLGRSGEVVRRIPLAAETVAADWPLAPRPQGGPTPARAEAQLSLD